MHCASLTAHNKMAALRKSLWSNIIKMKLTEEKRTLLEVLLAVVSCRGETQCGGNVHKVSSTRVSEFDFLKENLDSGCLTCASSLWFSFKRFLYHIVSLMWYLEVNSKKTDFLILSFPFHIHSILKLAPVLSQKSEKMHLVSTFSSSTAKTSSVTSIFYFMILIRTVLPFDEKKIGTNLWSVFWQLY